MGERRPTNSELRLDKLEREEPEADEERGILELFVGPEAERDEDTPLRRDTSE